MQHLMHHVTISLQQSKITLQNNFINNTSITQPTLSFYLWLKMYNLQLSRKLLWLEPYCSTPEVQQTSSKAGSGINILYLLTGPIGPTGYHYQIHKTVYGLPAAEYTHTHTHTHTPVMPCTSGWVLTDIGDAGTVSPLPNEKNIRDNLHENVCQNLHSDSLKMHQKAFSGALPQTP